MLMACRLAIYHEPMLDCRRLAGLFIANQVNQKYEKRIEPALSTQSTKGVALEHGMSEMKATANAHMRRDMETVRKWVCKCEDCHQIRSLIGIEKTLSVWPLVRKIEHLEEQLQGLPDGPEMRALLDQYLKLNDELANVVAK